MYNIYSIPYTLDYKVCNDMYLCIETREYICI